MNRMIKLFACVSVVVTVLGLVVSAPAGAAEIIRCEAEVDTQILHGGIYYGYPDYGVARATNWVGGEALFRFDLSPLVLEG